MMRLKSVSECMNCEWKDTSDKADLNGRKHVEGAKHSVITTSYATPADDDDEEAAERP